MMFLYQLADWFFLLFHAALSVFNLVGWIWRRTRRANLVTLALTGLSWTFLGIWYGFGYCPLTDWHWDVLRELGVRDLPNSYMKYLLDRLTGLDLDAAVVDAATGISFVLALAVSVFLNLRDFKNPRSGTT